MATRFYPDPTNVPSVSPGYDDLWTDTTAAVRRKLTIDTPGDNASTSFEVSETSASIVHKLAVQFVSEPLDSISATLAAFKFQFRCVENDAKSDAKIISCIRKCDSDGSNDVDIQSQLASLTEFDDAVLTNRGRTSYNANDQALSQGDRLIFEIGVYFSNTKTASYSGTVNVTDNSFLQTNVDFYPTSNRTFDYALWSNYPEIGQSFEGDGSKLEYADFYLSKLNSPTGTAYARLYEHTGTYGTDGVPGDLLKTSTNSLDVSTLDGTPTLTTFEFDGLYTLTNTTKYFIVLGYDGGDGTNYVKLGVDATTVSHAGNYAVNFGGWSAYVNYDLIFYVYTLPPQDLPENDTETAAYNSWIETGDTFTVASGDPPAEVVKLGPMFAFA